MNTESGSAAAGPPGADGYDDGIVRLFVWAAVAWGVAGMVFGAVLALQLVVPALNMGAEHASFGRVRPMHTNAVVFAFIGNAVFAAVYYATQRLCGTRVFSGVLGRMHFWGWQAIVAAGWLSLPLGLAQGRALAEMEWPIDIAIAVVWIGLFGVNFFGTLARRSERRMPVPLWFFIATVVGFGLAHVFGSLALPIGPINSIPVYGGVGDAFVTAWYGQSIETFLLVMPFLGMMYYFLPLAAGRPIYSRRLAALHFWAILVLAGGAGPRMLYLSPAPDWISTLGLVCGVALWMPLWGGLVNGVLTLRGSWGAVRSSTPVRFFAAALGFYGLATLEGTVRSLRPVAAATRFTDVSIGHAHALGLGWNGLMIFGVLYWLAPRIFRTPLANERTARAHFWIALAGASIYVLAVYAAGLIESFSWFDLDAAGMLAVPDAAGVLRRVRPLYWARAVGGGLYLAGAVMCLLNLALTWSNRTAARAQEPTPAAAPVTDPAPSGTRTQGAWHRRLEDRPMRFTACVLLAAAIGGIVEGIPVFLARPAEPISAVTPYTPLELAGRSIYIAEGCSNCHSQLVRPIYAETMRYTDYSGPGSFVYDHPTLWGTRRIGPDLAREGMTNPNADWHYRHFRDPQRVTPGSVMPAFTWLYEKKIDFDGIQSRIDGLATLGVPYGDAVVRGHAAEMARIQAREIARLIEGANGTPADDIWDTEVIALIAYVRRLGTEISGEPSAAPAGVTNAQ